MKKLALLLLCVLTLVSCHTHKNVVYFQDTQSSDTISKQVLNLLTLRPGDKVSIFVNSAATPEQAQRFNIIRSQSGAVSQSALSYYTINDEGYVTVPGLPAIKAAGLTRSQLESRVQTMLREDLLRDAVVTVDCQQRYVTVLGEVRSPGRVDMQKDYLTILEALGSVGDLNIQAKRSDIQVFREMDGQQRCFFVDIRSKDLFQSPVYYLQPGDVVYVQPNKVRQGQSTINDNSFRSVSTWLSMASMATSITILITNATRSKNN